MSLFGHIGNGKLLKGETAGKLAVGCTCCCSESICPGGWRIVDYVDGMIDTSCAPSSACGAEAVWDGSFSVRGGGSLCEWVLPDQLTVSQCIDGKQSSRGQPTTAISKTCVDNQPFYQLRISTHDADIVWFGEKTGGDDFSGIYTQTSGCAAGPSTLEIEAIP